MPGAAIAMAEGNAEERSFFETQEELVKAQLRLVRMRVRCLCERVAAITHDDVDFDHWPAELAVAETAVEARVRNTHGRGEMPMVRLRDQFALSPTEERVLWTLIANELCPITRTYLRKVATEETAEPTTDTLRRVVYGNRFGRAVWHELGEQGGLRRFGLIERADTGDEVAEHRRTWKVARRVLALVHGELELDPELESLARIEENVPCVDDLETTGDALSRIADALNGQDLVVLSGHVGQGRRSLLVAVAAANGLGVLRVHGREIAKERSVARSQLRLLARECRLLGLVPLICDLEELAASAETFDRLDLVEQELTGLVLATAGRAIGRRWARPPITIELAPLSGVQRASLWARALPMATAEDTEILSTMYPLAPALIEEVGTAAIKQSSGGPMTPDHIAAGLRAVLDHRLAGLATRITVTQDWSDLVLPDDQVTSIIELLARIRERGRVYEEWGFAQKLGKGLGVSALFSGPPGTGKTMAAGLVARSLNAELYQVDLSKIVSKWIGETEKNLAALFDAAEAGHAILLFDEADSLFGKRTDVRSSNDRHANQEVNFLLQRLESYAGICILTTNHETAIDEAFRRRLSVHVRFPMPEAEERQRLWSALIPKSAPVEGKLPFEKLASAFVMSGGYIKNAVLRAAFLAADEQGSINAVRLERAALLEYEAMGKVVASHLS